MLRCPHIEQDADMLGMTTKAKDLARMYISWSEVVERSITQTACGDEQQPLLAQLGSTMLKSGGIPAMKPTPLATSV